MPKLPEEWRPIKGYETLYEISNRGNIKALTKTLFAGYNATSVRKEKILSPYKMKGYLLIGLNKEGKRKCCLVHRIVAQTFIDNPLNLPEVNHLDLNKLSNKSNNLEWCTRKQNMEHATKNGRIKRGEEAAKSKVTLKEVAEIRLNPGKLLQKEMAKKHKISCNQISRIVNRLNWAHC